MPCVWLNSTAGARGLVCIGQSIRLAFSRRRERRRALLTPPVGPPSGRLAQYRTLVELGADTDSVIYDTNAADFSLLGSGKLPLLADAPLPLHSHIDSSTGDLTLRELPSLRLEANEQRVDLFVVSLLPPEGHRLEEVLSDDELERAARFRMEKHRRRFVVARAVLRMLLAAYTTTPAQAIRFRYGSAGKPSIDHSIRFNMSDSDDCAIYAVTENREIGVDLELLRAMPHALQLAERFFSSPEVASLRSVNPARIDEAFFTCWTRKEAYVKARGEGLTVPLHNFAVSVLPGEPPALLHAQSHPEELSRWSFHAIDVAGSVASLVVEGKPQEIRKREIVKH